MKKLLLLLFSAFLIQPAISQVFAPSQQAQGYIESKNINIDYTTGIFHYSIPVYTLESGEFKLPISLNYTGKGVKAEDKSGIIGYNWNLNTGGVVTRTIRGGRADETTSGYIHQTLSEIPTSQEVEQVNKREIDGESDIFTAVFNGQSINFIIRHENNSIIAEPLERTNVRIEHVGGYSIHGWIITDEDGNKFYFNQKEYSANIINEEAISFNGVRNQTYVSSWYLSKIEPLNSSEIVYNYKADVLSYSPIEQENIDNVFYTSYYTTTYQYGRPMIRRSYDFDKYKVQFLQQIELANFYLSMHSIGLQFENALLRLDTLMSLASLKIFELNLITINKYFRVMGQVADLTGIGSASLEVISYIDDLINQCKKGTSQHLTMAILSLEAAKTLLIRSLTDMEEIRSEEIYNGCSIEMKSPILDNIVCQNRTIRFEYKKKYSSTDASKLRAIIVEDAANNIIQQVELINNYDQLTQLSLLGKDDIVYQRFQFQYFDQGGISYDTDGWGYYREKKEDVYQYPLDVDRIYSKRKSLSKIITTDKGEIHVDYEPNVIILEPFPRATPRDYAGIRIKSLTLTDPETNHSDSINFLYPSHGTLIHNFPYLEDIVSYQYGFSDRLSHSQPKYDRHYYLPRGNNGVFYNYVEEQYIGKGKKTYLFFNSPKYATVIYPDSTYKFWIYGLPLGSAVYDNDGNLKSITRNRYYADGADFSIYGSPMSDLWFSQCDASIKYSKSKPQIRAYEYYMNYKDMKAYYQNQKREFAYMPDPYEEVFLPNIEPRTWVKIPAQTWDLVYGGKVLLKSQEEYRIEGDFSTESSEHHFRADLNEPYNRIEYFYDDLDHSISPTRISMTDSQGDTNTTVIRRVINMDENAPGMEVIEEMKARNILSPVIKTQNLTNNKLQKETVYLYQASTTGNKTFFGMEEEKSYIPSSEKTISSFSNMPDNSIYSYPAELSAYITEKRVKYHQDQSHYLPATITDRSETSAICYDLSLNVPIMNVKNCEHTSIAAFNSSNREIISLINFDALNGTELIIWDSEYEYYNSVLLQLNDFETQNSSPEHIEYINSKGYKTIKKCIEGMATRFESIPYTEWLREMNALRNNQRWVGDFRTAFFSIVVPGVVPVLYNELLRWLCNTPTIPGLVPYQENLTLNVTNIPIPKLKLYLVSQSNPGSINYTIAHSGGNSTGSVSPVTKQFWNMQVLDIDLSSYNEITSVSINKVSSPNLAYLALVPGDCDFEATAYNSDGTVFCKFNQLGQMELYEYDGTGRILKVSDHQGNTLKEYNYNTVLN